MPITMMTSPETLAEQGLTVEHPSVRVVRDYPGHAEGDICHSFKCPHYNEPRYAIAANTYSVLRPECGAADCRRGQPLYMLTEFEGLVLSLGEHNGYDDSDFYAMVWSDANGRPVEVTYASTRGWTYPNNAQVDATPEVLAKYEAWKRQCAKERAERHAAAAEAKRLADLKAPARGKLCRVVKGRKVPVGTEGVCVGLFDGSYGMRCGISDAEGTVHWTATSNVEAVLGEDGEPVMLPVPPRKEGPVKPAAPRSAKPARRQFYPGRASRLRW